MHPVRVGPCHLSPWGRLVRGIIIACKNIEEAGCSVHSHCILPVLPCSTYNVRREAHSSGRGSRRYLYSKQGHSWSVQVYGYNQGMYKSSCTWCHTAWFPSIVTVHSHHTIFFLQYKDFEPLHRDSFNAAEAGFKCVKTAKFTGPCGTSRDVHTKSDKCSDKCSSTEQLICTTTSWVNSQCGKLDPEYWFACLLRNMSAGMVLYTQSRLYPWLCKRVHLAWKQQNESQCYM